MNFLTICDGLLLSPQEFQAEIEGSFSTFISISDDGGFWLLRNVEKKSSFVVWTLFIPILVAK